MGKSIKWGLEGGGLVDDPTKAEYMAYIEDAWRSSVARLVELDLTNPEVHGYASIAAETQSLVHGPNAVSNASRAWDAYHSPSYPPNFDETMDLIEEMKGH